MDWSNEHWLNSGAARGLLGGILIGLSSSLLLFTHGRVAGISGIFGGLLHRRPASPGFRLSFLGGLIAAGALFAAIFPQTMASSGSLLRVAIAGLLVGYGTRLSNGCTSGHGVCGLSRLSARSIVATLTFIATGAVTVFVLRHIKGVP